MAKRISDLYADNPITSLDGTEYVELTKAAASGAATSRNLMGAPFPTFTVATVPSAAVAGKMIYVSDESGGAVMAFSDGTNWRRVTDRVVVS